jgi:DNA repair protein RecN (Recombination protein N)
MLAFLRVKGFAIIDELDVEFGEGLNVITGETGAGKSIIINALSTLLSAKVSPDMVRGASEQAEVVGHCFHGGEEYILRRIIGAQGRSRAYVNEAPVTAKRLEELGEVLVRVYGQNESQQLLGKENYVAMLDRFLGLHAEQEALAFRVRRLAEVNRDLEARKKAAEGQEREIELLTFQLDEIEREHVEKGEEERIRERLKVLRDAARIRAGMEAVGRGLYEEEQSVHASLASLASLLRPFPGIEWVEGSGSGWRASLRCGGPGVPGEGEGEGPRLRAGRAGGA